MEQIIITKPNGNRVPMQSRRTATDVTAAKQSWVLNGDDTVDITVKSPFRQTYDIGDKITIFGRDYTLNRLSKPKKTGMHEFEYSLQFEGVQYDLLRASYDVTIDTTNNELQDVQGDSLTGDLRRFLTVLVANANRVFPGKWALGVCPETKSDITKTFGESDNCLSVLQSILGEFDESYFFDIQTIGGVYTINIRSTSQTLPFTLEFGKGNGLYMLSRDNVSSSNIVTRLKVYGSASNITSKYRADRLCLPGKTKGQSYIEDAQAVARYGIFEGRKHFDNIKPTFTGHVQAVGDSVCEFIDPTISFDLNAVEADGKTTVYLIDGVSAKVHFNSGNLAGYEFEIAKYDHATHKVTLRKFTDDRGDVFPSETSAAFQFRASDGTYSGDEYKIVDIALPQELVDKAEAELLEAGQKYYEQNSQPKVQYSLSVTKAFIEKNFATDAGVVNVFVPGDYVRVKDDDIGVDKAVRIKSITRNVLDPYDYSLNLSDTVTTTVTNRVLSDLIDIDKIIEINNLKDPARARANWRSSREVLDMVFDPEGDYYTDKIKPNSIDTLALSVGAKSMQFGLTNTVFQPNYNGNPKLMRWQGGVLTHYTINEDSAVSWVLGDGQITLSPDSQPFYIYAR
ncbi:MAG: phage tail protein, partial [Roseburia sp.]|nr:phage tail protein [Roseburia sp.]